MSLLKFFKKKDEKTVEEDNEQHKHKKVDLRSLPVDPAERPSMKFYHVNQRDEIRRAYLQKGPFQPQNHKFPQRAFGDKHRRFNLSWFDGNKYWLEYSIKEDAAFCLCCYLFKSNIPNQGELESGTGLNQEVGIKRPSDTRWGSHFASLLNIKNIYSSICEVLEDLGEDNTDRDRKPEAICILKSLKSFDFVFCLHLMVDILGFTNHLNTALQRKDQDILNAMNQVSSSKKAIQEIRDVGWEPLLGNVTLFCEKYDVQVVDMKDAYYNGISRRRGSQVNNLHHYHVDVFKAVIDMQLQELNHRFNEVNTKLLLSIACLCPCESFKAFDLDKLMEMATLYQEEFPTEYDLQVLEVELKNYIKDVREDERFNQLKSIGKLSKKMVEEHKHIIFPKVYLLLKFALILHVATTSVERAFSAMKLVKTDIHNKMGDQFLSDSLVSYIEKCVLESISNDTIVRIFPDIRPRRVQL